MKQVKNKVSKQVKKDSLLDIVFTSIQAGKSLKQITIELNISKQKLQYYIDKLKKNGDIVKVGYGTWKTSKNRVGRYVRGHGFVWHIKLPKQTNIWELILTNKKINFRKINKGYTYQFYFKDNNVWLSKNSIVIYDIKSYFGFNAVDSKKYAFYELKQFLISLESKLGVNLRDKKGNYIVKTSRSHYSLIKNCLAMQCNKENKKINVYNERGLWFTIDNSFNLDEAETIHPETSLTDNLGIQRYFNEHKETNFEVTPKFILGGMDVIMKNQLMFAQNIESHIEAVKKLGDAVEELKNEVKRINGL